MTGLGRFAHDQWYPEKITATLLVKMLRMRSITSVFPSVVSILLSVVLRPLLTLILDLLTQGIIVDSPPPCGDVTFETRFCKLLRRLY